MNAAPAQRYAELDFFRGLVLLVIVVDHIGGSMLSRVTLHAYALCDAAEVFVFLGGFATAIAYNSLAARHTEAAARQRFIKRAFEIYRAFLFTAGLMLFITAVLNAFEIDAPNMPINDLDGLMHAPLAALRDILLLRRQPYLASVLPMYTFFALLVPLALPIARSRGWWLLVAASAATWLGAREIAAYLPTVDGVPWDFNPFAWQFLFVLGIVARCQPIYPVLAKRPVGWFATAAALAVVAAGAYYRLRIEPFRPIRRSSRISARCGSRTSSRSRGSPRSSSISAGCTGSRGPCRGSARSAGRACCASSPGQASRCSSIRCCTRRRTAIWTCGSASSPTRPRSACCTSSRSSTRRSSRGRPTSSGKRGCCGRSGLSDCRCAARNAENPRTAVIRCC